MTRQEEAWGSVLDEVIKMYIAWKYPPLQHIVPEPPAEAEQPDRDPPQTYAYSVGVYDIFTLTERLTIQRSADSISPAIDLMRHGYLAKTPIRPTVAVAVATLQLLYRLRQCKPSYSIEAFTKVVCDYYNVCLSLFPFHILV